MCILIQQVDIISKIKRKDDHQENHMWYMLYLNKEYIKW